MEEHKKDQEISEVTFNEVLDVFLENKRFILIFTAVASILLVIYSLSLPNMYKSTALLVPVDNEADLSTSLGGLSSIGSIAGISLPDTGVSKTDEGIAKMQSFKFFRSMLVKENMMVPLIAAKSWDPSTNELIIDSSLYDIKGKSWKSKNFFGFPKSPPTELEAYKEFKDIFSIVKDRKTGIITVSIEFYSPTVAKNWLDKVINNLNDEVRDGDVDEASISIKYLNEQVALTSFNAVKIALSELIKKETQTIMLARSTPEYAFKVIDPAYMPEKKSKPSRALICVIGASSAFLVSLLYSLIARRRNKKQ